MPTAFHLATFISASVFVGPDANKFVLRPIHPGADNAVLKKIIDLIRVNRNQRVTLLTLLTSLDYKDHDEWMRTSKQHP